ncbi:N-6 DNA methylase [Paracoccus sp. MKU1]|uniref:N-6 DNA methylase n=1 Tax=Paracoccus sp. MKU1 TaxID=1745182 RepID=UPI0007191289|nr:N-6 DNA methylase [Paracoccus sp. MKU1]KRW94313.1 hypothetical protein AQY21_20505 [Paracoccus sp. MKU1]
MKIERHIMDVLEAAQVDGNKLVLVGQLERKVYTEANKVLEAIGGKWSRKDKAHVFPESVADILDPILLTGEYTRNKQDFGQFDTPEALAYEVAARADIQFGDLVLEPSAGTGRLVAAALESGARAVHCIELDPKRAAHLRDAFDPIQPVAEGDFLEREAEPEYNRVVMNPPFAKQADIDHVRHAFDFLAPGGRLVAIMSASVMFRTNAKAASFRDFVDGQGGVIEPLPDGSFKESGTGVNTCLVVIDKVA